MLTCIGSKFRDALEHGGARITPPFKKPATAITHAALITSRPAPQRLLFHDVVLHSGTDTYSHMPKPLADGVVRRFDFHPSSTTILMCRVPAVQARTPPPDTGTQSHAKLRASSRCQSPRPPSTLIARALGAATSSIFRGRPPLCNHSPQRQRVQLAYVQSWCHVRVGRKPPCSRALSLPIAPSVLQTLREASEADTP